MEPLAILLALAAAVLHATWYAMVKVNRDRYAAMTALAAFGAASGPVLILLDATPAWEAWPYLLTSVVLHIGYNTFLILAYRVADFSHAYPLARGSAPMLATAGGVLLAGDVLTTTSFIGIVVVCVGIIMLSMHYSIARLGWGGLGWPLATGLMISGYTVVDGMGVRASGAPLGYIGWLFFLDAFPLVLWSLVRERRAGLKRGAAAWKLGLFGGAMSFAAYGLVIYAMSFAAIGPVAAVRETSVIMAAAIGAFLFKEGMGLRRIAAATVVVVGVALLAF